MAARTLARRRLLPFIKRYRPKYKAGWVHEDICRRLERFVAAVERQEEPRLLLCVPVRHGKSEIGSRHFPAWVLGKHPDWEMIAASGASSLAMSFSRYLRDLLRDDSYQSVFPTCQLDPASQSVENWNTTRGGGYLAAGIGTMITGRGAHILLIDDAVKDAEAADSQTIRDNVWEWYISTALSRLAPGGGVLTIMCMTGDTAVRLANGSECRLDRLLPGMSVATYREGRLAVSTVAAVKSSGHDSVLKITTSSGRIARANGRHPFLAVTPTGELTWVRARALSTAHKIVTVPGSGASGKESIVLSKAAMRRLNVEACAVNTTSSKGGRTDIARDVTATKHDVMRVSSIGMGSRQQSTMVCIRSKAAAAQFAANTPRQEMLRGIGSISSPSITATTQGKSEDCSATTAMQELDTLPLSPLHRLLHDTSEFILEAVTSVEHDGEEEVFDVQVTDTENFIANGLVSHNTWWHDDDLAGRLQQLSQVEGADTFEVVKYPAINDLGDEYILPDDSITQLPPGSDAPEGARLTRKQNTALHPERYTLESLLKRKATYYAQGQQRWWAALYQQNPAPEEGAYFTKKMFRYYANKPHKLERNVYQAWDFAITEKQQADYIVGATGELDVNDNLHVVDIDRFKSGDSFIIVEAMLDAWERHGSEAVIGVEDGQIWRSIEAVFMRRCQERKLYPSFEVLKPFTDKLVRAQPLRGRMQLGKVWFPETAPWMDALRQELLRFPTGKHDDQIDALAWLVRLVLSHSAPQLKKPKELASWKDKLKGIMNGTNGASHMSA